MPTLMVVDAQGIFRAGLVRLLLLKFPGATIAEAGSLHEAVERITVFRPDLILLDLDMPRREAFEFLRHLRMRRCEIPVLTMAGTCDIDHVQLALQLGARGCVLKRQTFNALGEAVKTIVAGKQFVPRILSHDSRRASPKETSEFSASISLGRRRLTEKQKKIALSLAQGFSNKEIAVFLNAQEGAVKAQVRSLLRKIGARNRTEAAIALARSGFVDE